MAILLSSKPGGCYRGMLNEKTQAYVNNALEQSMVLNPTSLPPKENQAGLLSRTFTDSCSCGCGTQKDYGYIIANVMEAIYERNTATEETIHQCNIKVRKWLTTFEDCFDKEKEHEQF